MTVFSDTLCISVFSFSRKIQKYFLFIEGGQGGSAYLPSVDSSSPLWSSLTPVPPWVCPWLPYSQRYPVQGYSISRLPGLPPAFLNNFSHNILLTIFFIHSPTFTDIFHHFPPSDIYFHSLLGGCMWTLWLRVVLVDGASCSRLVSDS